MSFTLKSMPSHQEHLLKQERLAFEITILSDATPADKSSSSDIPGLVYVRTEDLTDATDAVEELDWTAPVDNDDGDSIFGILIDLDGDIADKVYTVTLTNISGTSATYSLSGPGAAAGAYLTDAGNIAIEVAATGLDLSADDPVLLVTVDYRQEKP